MTGSAQSGAAPTTCVTAPGFRLRSARATAFGDDGNSQVTQRPGCSRFATSVSTLTTGSQATVGLRSPDDLVTKGAGVVPRATEVIGTRIRTDITATPSSR